MKPITWAIIGLIILSSNIAYAGKYIGVGTFQSEFWGSEYDREYQSKTSDIRQLTFGYNNKDIASFFGDIRFDEDRKVREFALGFALKDKMVRVEKGSIKGEIVSNRGQFISDFDSTYRRIDILDGRPDGDGFQMGIGLQKYAVPHLFNYNDGSYTGRYLQDQSLSFTMVGLGFYYDAVYNYLMKDQYGFHSDWYFSTSTLAISLAYAEASDSPDLQQYDVGNQSWVLWGNSGTYELGWLWGYQSKYAKTVFNIGYHLRANTFLNIDPSKLFADKADRNDILLDSHQTILHGLTAAVTAYF